jgi:hypothetical protein
MLFARGTLGLFVSTAIVLVGCSGGSHAADQPPPKVFDPTHWVDGMEIVGDLDIPAGQNTTIAPGANVTLGKNVTVTIHGTLTASSKDLPITIFGNGGRGFVVDGGGTLNLDGVNIAASALAIFVKNGTATYSNGKISDGIPFQVAEGASLTLSHATIINPTDDALVAGSLKASYIDYKVTTVNAIVGDGPKATIDVEDSLIQGEGNLTTADTDGIIARNVASLTVSHTEITGLHCGMHFYKLTNANIDFMSMHDNNYAFSLSGTDTTGTRTIKSSNIFDNGVGLFQTDSDSFGLVEVSDGYFNNNGKGGHDDVMQRTNVVKTDNMQAKTIAGTGPRPEPMMGSAASSPAAAPTPAPSSSSSSSL